MVKMLVLVLKVRNADGISLMRGVCGYDFFVFKLTTSNEHSKDALRKPSTSRPCLYTCLHTRADLLAPIA